MSPIAIGACAVGASLVGGFVGFVIGDRRANGMLGAVLGAIAGPIGWLLALWMPAWTRCPACRKWTPWYPSIGVPRAHLRCRRCGGIVD